jgi:hypothetical protein
MRGAEVGGAEGRAAWLSGLHLREAYAFPGARASLKQVGVPALRSPILRTPRPVVNRDNGPQP